MSTEDASLRKQLRALLKGGQAHADLHTALADFPFEKTGERPHGLPYSAWQLLEHVRIVLQDLLDFSTNAEYQEMKWPDDYWPKEAAPSSLDAWQKSERELMATLDEFLQLIDTGNLYDTIPWGKHNATLLREILLAADHNSYHAGELIVLRRLLGVWKK